MSRRGENIYKRKDGRWEARILKSDGKYGYVYAKTYTEVRKKKKNFQECFPKVKKSGGDESPEVLFETWLVNVSGRVKPSTYENYYRCIHQ